MPWSATYDGANDETTIEWTNGSTTHSTTVNGWITKWRNGYPATDTAREAVASLIQNAGTPERIRMQFDFNYGFEKNPPSI